MADGFEFKPIVEDYIAVAQGSFIRGLRRRRFIVRAACIALIGGIVGAGIGILGRGIVTITEVLFGISAAILWLATLLIGIFALMPRRSRRLFRQQRALDRVFSLTWTDERLAFKSDTSMSDMSWSDYHGWFETKDVFAFGLNEQLYHFAPKRAMSVAMIDDLRRTAQIIGPA